MITDLKQLQVSGGPFLLTRQIGYGRFYLAATTLISNSGDGYNMVKITFADSAGDFIPSQPIFLCSQNTIVNDISIVSFHMKLTIKLIQLTIPTPKENGQVTLECSFTDINGQGGNSYKGSIAQWTSTGPIQDN